MGLASFFGLAILALLYFSQARDVRRLREWAGRAPERAAAAAEQASAVYAQQAEAVRRDRPSGRSMPARYVALIVGGVIVFGTGIGVGAMRMLGGDDEVSTERAASDGGSSNGKRPPVVPGTINVAILNGTDVPGLAAKLGDDVEANGFRLGAVTNSEQNYEFTVAMYERGHKREAEAVATAIGINRVRFMTDDVRSGAGSARVAVVAGGDRAEL